MKIIDAHCHFDPVYDAKNAEVVSYIKSLNLDYTEKGLFREMRQAGIGHAIVMSEHYTRNGFIKNLVKRHPKQLSGVATLNHARNISQALRGLETEFKKRTFIGIKFYTGYRRMKVVERKWDMVYRMAMKYDFPVIFHTGATLGSKAFLKYSHPLQFDELAVKYPKLKIVLAHFGNPWVMDAAGVVYKNPNVYVDLSGFIVGAEEPDKYLSQRLSQGLHYCGTNEQVFDRIMFGTDYPLVRQKEYVKFIEKLDLTKSQLQGVFYNNAKRLFRLK